MINPFSRFGARTLLGAACVLLLTGLLGTAAAPYAWAEETPERVTHAPAPAAVEPAEDRTAEPPLPKGASAGWWSAVQQDIAAAEYHVSLSEKTVLPDIPEALQAPNRAQGFRTYFTKTGIRIVPRTDEQPSWSWGLELQGYGWAGDIRDVEKVEPRANENRVDYERAGLTEWYVNDPRGIEQGFTLDRPLEASEIADTSKVVVEMALSGGLGAYPSEDGQAIEFAHGNARVLRYAELKVTDAMERPLPARMEVCSTGAGSAVVRIVADAGKAVWPVTIDPLAASPNWTAESDQTSAQLGNAVGSAGDVNGDGYTDVILGAYYYDNGENNEGRALVYHGSASGLSATANWTTESDQAGANFGRSVASAGDVNGDGVADIIVGADWYDNGSTDEGRAFVYYGNSGSGRAVLTQQLKGGGSSTLQQPWGSTADHDDFQVRAHHTSPFGRECVKEEIQGCPSGVPFGDASCVSAVTDSWTDTTASAGGVSLTATLSGLNDGKLYRWRERTLRAPASATETGITPPPNPAHGPWRRLGAQSVEADIRTPDRYLLTVSKVGGGNVTSGPSGIDCGMTCSHEFLWNTSVELTAAADSGWGFTGWSGEGCSGAGTCQVTMTVDRAVTATFTNCTVVVQYRTVSGTATEESCGTLAFGPSVLVSGTGNLTARAATLVSLRNGFEVASGGTFTAGIDANLAP